MHTERALRSVPEMSIWDVPVAVETDAVFGDADSCSGVQFNSSEVVGIDNGSVGRHIHADRSAAPPLTAPTVRTQLSAEE